MEREQVVFVIKLVAYALIIVGVIMLFAAFMFVITGSDDLLVVVWVIVGVIMTGIGSTTIKSVEENCLRVDIAAPNKKAPSMSMALDQYIKEANKRRR